jgi:general stress protein 26
MSLVTESEKEQFFKDVESAAKKAVWCALATVAGGEPRVRMVHPTWEGSTLWLATDPDSAKAQQLRANPAVDVQFQVAPDDFVHLMVRGKATVLDDQETKRRVWDVLDYDLSQFWPEGPEDAGYCVIRIDPERVELSEMFGTVNKRVWKA